MKKLLITLVVVAIIAVAVIIGVKTLILPPKVVIAEILPQDIAFYYSIQNIETIWKDIKTSRFWRDFSNLKLWKDIQIASGMEDLKNQFKENMGVDLSEDNLMNLIGKELAITITPGTSPVDPPKIVLLCRGKTKQSLTEVINPIVDKVKEADPTRIEKSEYEGNSITHIKAASPDQPEIYILVLRDILIVGLGDTQSTIQNIIGISNGKIKETLAATEKFRKIVNLADREKKELAGLFYIDFTKLQKYLKGLTAPGPEGAQAQAATGMEALDSMGGWTEIDKGLITKLYIYPNTEALDPQMKEMWEAKPQVPATLRFAPEKTLLYIVSSSLNLSSMWEVWQSNLKAQTSDQAQPILDNINKFEANWGIDLETDVLSLIGKEVAFIFSDINTEGLMPIPKLGLVIEVNDKDKMDTLIASMIAKNNEKAVAEQEAAAAAAAAEEAAAVKTEEEAKAEEGEEEIIEETPAPVSAPVSVRFQINLAEEAYEGNTIKALQLPLIGTGLAPGYTYIDKYLLVGATTKTLQEMIDVTKGKIKPLSQDPIYQDIAKLLPKENNQASYINTERLMDIGIGICNWVISFQRLSIPAGPPPEDPNEAGLFNQRKAQAEATIATINDNVIPLLKTLKALKVIATAAENKEDHIEQTLVLRVEDI